MYEKALFLRLHTVRRYYLSSSFLLPGPDDADAELYACYLRNGAPPVTLGLLRSWRLAFTLLFGAFSGSSAAGDGDECRWRGGSSGRRLSSHSPFENRPAVSEGLTATPPLTIRVIP